MFANTVWPLLVVSGGGGGDGGSVKLGANHLLATGRIDQQNMHRKGDCLGLIFSEYDTLTTRFCPLPLGKDKYGHHS